MFRRRRPAEPSAAGIEQMVRDRLYIHEAIDRALERWPQVAAAAHDAESTDELAHRLMEMLGIDETQAIAVLDQQIRRVTRQSRAHSAATLDELRQQLAELA